MTTGERPKVYLWVTSLRWVRTLMFTVFDPISGEPAGRYRVPAQGMRCIGPVDVETVWAADGPVDVRRFAFQNGEYLGLLDG
jgi:hypothetical protein